MESSNPLRNGDNIKLTSPRLTVPNVCLRFYYHMYGNKLGYLRVNTSHSNEVWRKTGDHGQVWTFVEISIQHQVGYKVGLIIVLFKKCSSTKHSLNIISTYIPLYIKDYISFF